MFLCVTYVCGPNETIAGKVMGKSHHTTGHEDPEASKGIVLLFILTSTLYGVDFPRHALASLPWERTGTHGIGGCVGPRAGPDGCGKTYPHWNWIPGPSSPSPFHTSYLITLRT